MATKKYPKLFEYTYKFGKTEDELLSIARGISTVSFDNDESVEDYQYLDGMGVAERDINGQILSWTFEGHREENDELQNLILDEMLIVEGDNRSGFFEITKPNGVTISGPATVTDIEDMAGEAPERTQIAFTITFAGKPEITKQGE